jgi:sporulation protein YlmC with PRC-barrel domain
LIENFLTFWEDNMLKRIALTLVALGVVAPDLVAQDAKAPPGSLVRSSQVMGLQLKDSAGQTIGEVKDVVLDRAQGTIAFVVVDFSDDVANAGDKLFAVPWESLKPGADHGVFTVNMTRDKLDKAPGFEKNQWPDFSDSAQAAEIRRFYGASAPPARVQPVKPAPHTDPALPPTRTDPAQQSPTRTDMETGRTDQFNRDPGFGQRIDTYSGTVKSLDRGERSMLVVNTDRGELGADLGPASSLERNQLVLDPNTQVTVKGYETMRSGERAFVATEIFANGRTVRLREHDQPRNTGATDVTLQSDRRMNGNDALAGSLRDVTGTVILVGSDPCGESAQGRQVTIRAADGDRVIALGPGNFLDGRGWKLRQNETVTVKGYETDYQGNRVFIATEVRRGNETWRLRNDDGTPVWR